MKDYIIINPLDNVAVVLRPFTKGEKIENVVLLEDIPQAHKIALKQIHQGENVIKYGSPIGHATVDIHAGEHVHTHNVATNLDDVITYSYAPKYPKVLGYKSNRTVDVYERSTGEYGIRNELWVIQTVGCVSGMAKDMIEKFKATYGTEGIDGIYTFQHPFGCSQMGSDLVLTRMLLQDMVKHPNAGGVLVLGLGCEENLVSTFKETLGNYDPLRTRFLIAQEVEDEVEEGTKLLKELYDQMKMDRRVTKPLSVLRIGLKCGGSDGMSGITANPLLGRFSDFLSINGATTVLGEVPEMFGAEKLLMERAKDGKTFEKIVDLINEFKIYFKNHNQVIYDNPSPGNKKGGITTLEDKSLGCTQKAGAAIVQDVLKMGERIRTNGLNLLCTPGNDLVATTTLGCSGCQMVLFTTGRGTPFGGFVPTVKIATNTSLATKKSNWIDFNAGDLVDKKNMDELLEDFIDLLCDIASGKKANEKRREQFSGNIYFQGWSSSLIEEIRRKNMKEFMDKDFLLTTETAKKLYHEHAEHMPIIDYHCHLQPKEIFEDKKFRNLAEVWLGAGDRYGDHYKWRSLRARGYEEDSISGPDDDYKKYMQFVESMPYFVGNPLYHWSHLEMRRYFDIEEIINEKNAKKIWDTANKKLETLTAREMMYKFKVDTVCTTDDPVDSLEWHKKMNADTSLRVHVRPAFRPDKAINVELSWFADWIAQLSQVVGYKIKDLSDLEQALAERIAFFHEMGSRLSDHALDVVHYAPCSYEQANAVFKKGLAGKEISELEQDWYKGYVLVFLGKEYHKYGWVQQYHIGALRNNSKSMLKKIGPDTGFDAIEDQNYMAKLSQLLGALDETDQLPKTILYCLNPRDNYALTVLSGCFQKEGVKGRVQVGTAWWFLDQQDGMRQNLETLMQVGLVAQSVGMLTDSRSFLAYPRHEYYRRLLCQMLGNLVESGQYPVEELETLGKIVEDVCYNNAKEFFGF